MPQLRGASRNACQRAPVSSCNFTTLLNLLIVHVAVDSVSSTSTKTILTLLCGLSQPQDHVPPTPLRGVVARLVPGYVAGVELQKLSHNVSRRLCSQ